VAQIFFVPLRPEFLNVLKCKRSNFQTVGAKVTNLARNKVAAWMSLCYIHADFAARA
tara:strand:- start:101264 stop:101434 length:171 start_codon:yes stop_codon:yes gene_type:complete